MQYEHWRHIHDDHRGLLGRSAPMSTDAREMTERDDQAGLRVTGFTFVVGGGVGVTWIAVGY
jgi:hypothetical protein